MQRTAFCLLAAAAPFFTAGCGLFGPKKVESQPVAAQAPSAEKNNDLFDVDPMEKAALADQGGGDMTASPRPVAAAPPPGPSTATIEATAPTSPPAAATASASPPSSKRGASGNRKIHTVAPKDTLYSLARQYYGAPGKWRTILDANRDVITDPNRLHVGVELVIP